ncbi:patatin-like phospholipase family protein [Mycobacterium sp. M1]|uniref:Patatin-like phospholipase family protein n=1 Tax=Mycolicibacter acidiphilus TaxID=2835306 RepID=A0ABS5RED8_9MYCO|nr:patatin-like phospholipase family protein [Mycolicibacter acidiphilus]MBS9532642.1 patatin-like phospholipase family protein [Mycolicibacter acidiphilus]
MTTAFVLSGGASLGSIQTGMLLALADAGIAPDLIVGTSVGAVNGGWLASRPDPAGVAGLADVWRSLSRHDVFPTRPIAGLLGFLGQLPSLVPNTNLRHLLAKHLEFTRLEDAPIPLHVVATDVLSGHDVLLSSGVAVDAIAASAAIPAVLPPVRINGRDLMDGGVVNNTPLSHAVRLGADTIYVLPTGYACDLSTSPKGAMAMALHALTLAINQRIAADIVRFEGTVDLRVVPPLCPVHISPIDFSHGAELIEQAQAETQRWLTQPPATGQAVLLAPHRHQH